jgi:leucyl aminopeptidase
MSVQLLQAADLPPTRPATPIWLTRESEWQILAPTLPQMARTFAQAQGFIAAPGTHVVLPTPEGGIAGIVVGLDAPAIPRADPLTLGRLPAMLPPGVYSFVIPLVYPERDMLALLLGSYRFDRYRAPKASQVGFVVPDGVDALELRRIADAVAMGRDMINTPASDLGPAELEGAMRDLGARYGARVTSVIGEDLLAQGYPMIHAVGRASTRTPRLIDLVWGSEDAPKVTLVGKGVCFDSGGLNIKPDNSMLLMKKDMGGAATALAAARMIMDADLRVRLRVLVPAVENMIAGNAFRPGDVLASRKGLTVEIGNTDAEGRLILADALARADEEEPDLLIDYATLTGAARVALGPDLPPLYTDDDGLAADMQRLGMAVADPVWRMPLWPPYDDLLKSKIADVNHISSGGHAGSITAALFLRRFVQDAGAWAHLDIFAWTPSARPGRPEGGEVQAARLTYALIRERYGASATPPV